MTVFLCTSARVPPFYECPPGFVGVGECSFPFGECTVGFCYKEDTLVLGEPGVCCVRRK